MRKEVESDVATAAKEENAESGNQNYGFTDRNDLEEKPIHKPKMQTEFLFPPQSWRKILPFPPSSWRWRFISTDDAGIVTAGGNISSGAAASLLVKPLEQKRKIWFLQHYFSLYLLCRENLWRFSFSGWRRIGMREFGCGFWDGFVWNIIYIYIYKRGVWRGVGGSQSEKTNIYYNRWMIPRFPWTRLDWRCGSRCAREVTISKGISLERLLYFIILFL